MLSFRSGCQCGKFMLVGADGGLGRGVPVLRPLVVCEAAVDCCVTLV